MGVSAVPFGFIGDMANFGVNLYNTINNSIWRDKEFAYNQQLNEQAQQNYREQMDFQKSVWNETKAREDNAIQRRVADMQAAGLNPVSATGASASSVSTVAQPHLSPSQSSPVMMKAINFDNAIKMAQLKMQKELNDATVNKIDTEAELNKARVYDVEASAEERRSNIDFLKSKTNLTDKQIDETAERMNLIRSQVDVNQKNAYKITQETNNIISQNKVINAQYEKLINDVKIDNIKAFETEFKNKVISMYPKEYQTSILKEWEKSSVELKLLNTTNATRISSDIRSWCDSIISGAVKVRFAFF